MVYKIENSTEIASKEQLFSVSCVITPKLQIVQFKSNRNIFFHKFQSHVV